MQSLEALVEYLEDLLQKYQQSVSPDHQDSPSTDPNVTSVNEGSSPANSLNRNNLVAGDSGVVGSIRPLQRL
jgi:hypothetical protein